MMYRIHMKVFLYHLLAIVLGILAIVPFLWMISTSLKSGGALLVVPIEWFPKEPTIQAYQKLFALTGMLRSIGNSLVVTAGAVLVALFSSSMAAFAFAKIRFKGSGFLFMLFIASMMLPSHVLFIPLYLIMNDLHLVDTLFALILPYTFKAFAVFMLRQQMVNISDAYLDAAAIDGASLFRSFITVFLPLCKTALATLAIIIAMDAWNDYLLPLVLMTSPKNYTLPIILNALSGQFKTAYDLLMAGSLISVVPLLVIYIGAQRYFASGLQIGGVKG
ncbi:carbohydrate ABC transporter permease [Sphaerochaeta halotolerans]|uniref:carbohydrate ABC transporter permease n=1 Tax=Sphaerochaeta halotolerans TaxID=2293840 RepID=UPI001368CFED|nr:carbohydrate ABC transporter permease [Sphaerochaeta halotolerans]MDK2860275.1 multiple sugar transport system permease protein [Sphaerochaeta sp.]MXI87017.1 ABC transporter permease subunit [Sphaerochaeta halotolerans]